MTKYYVSNGQENVDYGWILKGIDKPVEEGFTAVIDELSNVGDELVVSNRGIVEISKADYEELYELNMAFGSSDVMESYQLHNEIERLLAKYV